jgi:hypothetical protein
MEVIPSSETSVLTIPTRRSTPEDCILHSHCRENLKSYIALSRWALWRRSNMLSMRYELVLYIPENSIRHSQRHGNLKSHIA